MSSEDATPRMFQNDESTDHADDVTTISSLSSISPLSPPCPTETFTSLLLQIQQHHTSEVHKLQEKVSRWRRKCNKLAKIANDNASMAKECYKQNKLLKTRLAQVKCRLGALQSPRHDGSAGASAMPVHRPNQVPPKVEADTHNSPNEDLSTKPSRAPGRLTARKSNKKVRYAEIASTKGCPKHVTPLLESTEQKRSGTDPHRGVGPRDSKEPQSTILAPDTCISPAVHAATGTRNPGSGATSVEYANSKQTPDGHGQRMRDQRHHTVAETLADDVKHSELHDASLIDSPSYASTPVGIHSQTSHLSDSMRVWNYQSLQNPDSTRLNLVSSEMLGEPLLLISPMSKSESQYPVDLSSTQAKSPTFCGEGLGTPGSVNGKSRQHSTANAERNVPKPQEGNRSAACATDDSYDSEASILLLETHIPNRIADPFPSPRCLQMHTLSSKTATVSGKLTDVKSYPKETGPVNSPSTSRASSSTTAPETIKQQTNMQLTVIPLKSQSNLSRTSASKKRKLHIVDEMFSTNYDETVLPDGGCFGKENSPGLDDMTSQTSLKEMSTRQIKQEKQVVPEKPVASKIKAKGSINLKQSKLMLHKIKPGMNKSARLMREYNGSSLVNVDSQSDAFMNQAIERSLLDQKGETGGKCELFKSEFTESEVIGEKFKIPTVPHRRQQLSNLETGPTEIDALKKPRITNECTQDLPLNLASINSQRDLNDSIDPLMDLTRIEAEGSQSSGHPGESADRERDKLERGLESGREGDGDGDLKQPESGEDSCLDLFDDEEEGPKSEGEMDQPAVRDETGFVKNFDEIPKVMDGPNYKYAEVVRKHDERKKLKGFGCKDCEAFYGNLSLTDAERDERIKMCSRHRAQFSPTHTPEHYWSIGFPDTQTCLERGYIKEGRSPDKRSRGRKKYKRLFAGKEVDGSRDDNDDN